MTYPKERDMEVLFGSDLWALGYEKSAAISNRRAKDLDSLAPPWKAIAERVRSVLASYRLVREHHFNAGMSIILSRKGAPRQSFHADFEPHELFKRTQMHKGCLPYPIRVLIVLQDGARLTLKDGKEVDIPRFAVCVFRGDLVHAGSAYL